MLNWWNAHSFATCNDIQKNELCRYRYEIRSVWLTTQWQDWKGRTIRTLERYFCSSVPILFRTAATPPIMTVWCWSSSRWGLEKKLNAVVEPSHYLHMSTFSCKNQHAVCYHRKIKAQFSFVIVYMHTCLYIWMKLWVICQNILSKMTNGWISV